MAWELRQYRTVWTDFADSAPKALKGKCSAHLRRLQLAGNVNAGLRSEHLRDGVLELKVSWNKQEYRFLYSFGTGRRIYVLRIFKKKTRKTPDSEINIALDRKMEVDLDDARTENVTIH